jgi:protease-4
MSRPLNADETALLEQYIDRGYKLFRKRVADGRKLKVEQVEEIAQGRVWLGNDALPIKLVDAVGSLNDAVKKAAELAKLKEYHATAYPEEESWLSSLFDNVTKKSYLDEEMQAALGEYYEPLRFLKSLDKQSVIQARMPYIINIR